MPRPAINTDATLPSLHEAIRVAKLPRRTPTDADRPLRRGSKPDVIQGQLSIFELPAKREER